MKTLISIILFLPFLPLLSTAQKVAVRHSVDMSFESDVPLKSPRVYHGISSAGCAQAVTLANNRSLTMIWQRQAKSEFGCGACVEEWKLTNDPPEVHGSEFLFRVLLPKGNHGWLAHDFSEQLSKFESGLRVYPSCIGGHGWGVWHSATAER